MSRWKQNAAAIATVMAIVYIVLTSAAWFVMRRPPDDFGQVMKHVPPAMMMVLPFETLWLRARAGTLQVGDVSPDFDLQSIDGKEHARLSAERGRPVVLIFGSYT